MKEKEELLKNIQKLAEMIRDTTVDEVQISRANLIITYIIKLRRYLGV